MDVLEAIYTTRAMRRLSADSLPEGVVPKLFDAAIRGPSSGNQMRLRFLCVTDLKLRQTIQRIYRECLDELNQTRYADTQSMLASGDQEDPAYQQVFAIDQSAQWLADNRDQPPMLIFVFGHAGGETTTLPCLWNLCLAARAEGLGTAITTLLKVQRARVEELLGLPPDGPWQMHAMVPIGYPLGRWCVARRRPANEVVYSEQWGAPVTWTVDEPCFSGDENRVG